MGYEIDFLPVGNGDTSGDAIVLRYGNLWGRRSEQTVVVIDGGYNDTGKAIIDHLDQYYATNRIDLVVSTHPDADHINGLRTVVDELDVDELWMHLPDQHSVDLAAMKATGWRNVTHMRDTLQKSLSAASDLEAAARAKGIPITEPFTGVARDRLVVVGPSQAFYEELLPQFTTYAGKATLAATVKAAIRSLIPETLYLETLTDDGETSPENNSSTVILLQIDDRSLIFTGDAGMPALENAADSLDGAAFDWSSVKFMQIPHHGSKRNVGPSVLDRFLGEKGQVAHNKSALASAGPDAAPKHPHKKVLNAFTRRGCDVATTAGRAIRYSHDAPDRSGWTPIEPLPLYTEVEDD